VRVLSISVLAIALLQTPEVQTGSIEGIVVRSGSNEPIEGAEVMVEHITTGTEIERVQPVTTGRDGRFVAADLPVGRYLLLATKSGYAAQVYGSRQTGIVGLASIGTRENEIGAMGTLIDVAGNRAARNIVIPMTPSGTVSGRVFGSDGQALVGMQVDLLPLTYDSSGRRYLIPLTQVDTDDRGEYRLYSVEPGRYYVCARWTQTALSRQEVNSEVRLVDAQDSNGRRYAPACYPSSPNVSSASIVEVKAGENLAGVDVVMRPVTQQTLRKIRGRVIDSLTGQPLSPDSGPSFALIPREADYLTSLPMVAPHLTAQGDFEVRDVAEGRYWLAVRFSSVRATGGSSARNVVASLDVFGGDAEGLVLNAVPTATISGRATLDGAPWSSADSDRFQVRLDSTRLGAYTVNLSANPSPAFFDSDGMFSIINASPGEYELVFTGLPPDAYVAEAHYGSSDALNERISISSAAAAARLEIAASTRSGQLTGTILDRGANPISNVDVVLVPDNSQRPDRYKTARTDTNGHFLIRGIAPDNYKLYSWERIERFGYFDAGFMRQYEGFGKALRITEGPNEAVSLQILLVAASR